MSYRTYKDRIISLLARCDNPDGLHRSDILAFFDWHKETYVLRALRQCTQDNSVIMSHGDMFTMNWAHANDLAVEARQYVTAPPAQGPRATTPPPTGTPSPDPAYTTIAGPTVLAARPTAAAETRGESML